MLCAMFRMAPMLARAARPGWPIMLALLAAIAARGLARRLQEPVASAPLRPRRLFSGEGAPSH